MILMATVKTPDDQEVGVLFLHPKVFYEKAMGWEGRGSIEILGDHYPALCQLVTTGEPEEMVKEDE